MQIPPVEPTNVLRQVLLAWERALRKGQESKSRRGTSTPTEDPQHSRDTERPPQIW